MSHFATVATKIKDLGCLERALKKLELGYTVAAEGETVTVIGWEKERVEARMKIETGCKHAIGLVTGVDGTYSLEADWWAIETMTGKVKGEFLDSIMREYAYETVMEKVGKMGYSVVTEREDAQKTLRVTVRRWQ